LNKKRVIARYLKAKKDRKDDWRDSGIGRIPWVEKGWNDVVDYTFEDEDTHPANKKAGESYGIVIKSGRGKDLDSGGGAYIDKGDRVKIYRSEGGSYVIEDPSTGNAVKVRKNMIRKAFLGKDAKLEKFSGIPRDRIAYRIMTNINLAGLSAQHTFEISHKSGNLEIGVMTTPNSSGHFMVETNIPAGEKTKQRHKDWQNIESGITKDLRKVAKDYSKSVASVLRNYGKVTVR